MPRKSRKEMTRENNKKLFYVKKVSVINDKLDNKLKALCKELIENRKEGK